MHMSATLSDDKLYRWSLERIWNASPKQRICLFVMLNPSTADAYNDDPTVGRCIAFAKSWGYDGLRIINLVPFRSPKPEFMYAWFVQQPSTVLTEFINDAVAQANDPDVVLVVLAHGRIPPLMRDYAARFVHALTNVRHVFALKRNKDGSPAHPLYTKGDLKPQPWIPYVNRVTA